MNPINDVCVTPEGGNVPANRKREDPVSDQFIREDEGRADFAEVQERRHFVSDALENRSADVPAHRQHAEEELQDQSAENWPPIDLREFRERSSFD